MLTYTRAFISEKHKVSRNEKRKKLHGFSYYRNIANFEAFWRDKNFSKNLLFLGRSELIDKSHRNVEICQKQGLIYTYPVQQSTTTRKNNIVQQWHSKGQPIYSVVPGLKHKRIETYR